MNSHHADRNLGAWKKKKHCRDVPSSSFIYFFPMITEHMEINLSVGVTVWMSN